MGRFEAGGYHDREGLATREVPVSERDGLGSGRKCYIPNTTWTWSFTLVALVQAIICLALECYVFGIFQVNLNSSARGNRAPSEALTIPTYLALFIFGFIYQLILVWDALRMKNTIQVIGIGLYNFGMLIYASVEVDQVHDAVKSLIASGKIDPDVWHKLNPYLIAAPCVIALGTVLLGFIAWKLYAEFTWSIYKHISADLRMKQRFLQYQIYIALLKFDFFFFLGFTVQFLVAVKGTTDAERYLTIVAIPITVILLLLAAYFTRRESIAGTCFVILIYFAAMAYFIFKLVRMYSSHRVDDYKAARNSLTTFASLTLVLLIVTMASAFLCMRNFGKGLKPHIQGRRGRGADDAGGPKYGNYDSYHGRPHQLDQVPSRMTID